MRRSTTLLAFGLLMAFAAATALAGDHPTKQEKKGEKKHEDMETMKVEVQQVYTKLSEGKEMLRLEVRGEDLPVLTVYAGEKLEADEIGMALADGDEIEIVGHQVTPGGTGETVFVAYEIRRGDQTWKLKHTKEEHEKHEADHM